MHVWTVEFQNLRKAYSILEGLDDTSDHIVEKAVSCNRMKVDALAS